MPKTHEQLTFTKNSLSREPHFQEELTFANNSLSRTHYHKRPRLDVFKKDNLHFARQTSLTNKRHIFFCLGKT